MTTISSVAVIGGGIAGAATAIALTKAGIEATIYEARPASTDTTGIMLTLGVNGIDALAALDAEHLVADLGFATPGITLRNHAGKRLGSTSTGADVVPGRTSRNLRRADLARVLLAEAERRGVRVERGRRLVGLEEDRDGVAAGFADGSTARAGALIGADGVYSRVRQLIDPNAPAPLYSGLITTGGYARGVPVDLPPGVQEMIFGRRAFFGYAAAPDGEIWWFVNLPRRTEPARGELQAVAGDRWRQEFARVFAGDAGPALELIEATPDFAPMTPIHSMSSVPRWHAGRCVLVGDAAHAPSPTSGQGASLAIEDAVVLAQALRDSAEPGAAWTAFETVRRPRVEKIVRAAARVNNSKAPTAFGRAVRDVMLPVILRLTANSRADQETYGHHLEWTAGAATGGSGR